MAMTRILLAEDSPTQAIQVVAALEDHGFDVTLAPDGAAAWRLFRGDDFDVVISDVVMPGMSGYELCRAIKSECADAPPVMLMTSLTEPIEVIHGLQCGADNFLRKPCQSDLLIRRIERALANAQMRKTSRSAAGVDVTFLGETFAIASDKAQILDLLISTFEDTIAATEQLRKSQTELAAAYAKIQNYASELEDRVRERTADLARSNDSLKSEMDARQRTEGQLVRAQRMEAIGSLTGGMAHDFNNLLGVIIGNLDLLRPMIEHVEDADELATDALGAALRGADLTRRLLAFARRQPLQPERVNVSELIEGLAKLLTRLLGEHIKVELDLAAETWPVVVDPAQLEASLTNLATNARDAMPKGGRLRIFTANRVLDADYAEAHVDVVPGDYVLLAVSDTGTGMAPETAGRIFEPFFTTKAEGKGTGLGLAMVYGFMKQSHGHINVYSEPGEGTTFRLYLPRSDVAVGPSVNLTMQPAMAGCGEVVLAVEDNPAMRKILVMQLRALNYKVLEAGTAAEAIDLLEREKIDVMFSDVIMPGEMNGIELARASLERYPAVRVVLASGFAQPLLVKELTALKSVRLLSKPYRRDELAHALRTAIEA
jgi:signal transduction histidine kinase